MCSSDLEAQQAREDAVAAVRAATLVGQPRAQMLGETLGVFACLEMGDVQATQLHLEQEMQLIRQLGARRFEAQNIEMHARLLLDSGRRKDAVVLLHEALAICAEVGMQFTGPKAVGALCCALEDDGERAHWLARGAELLRLGSVGHNHLWFYRDAIEAMLSAGDAPGALRYVTSLEEYTQVEPLPWAELFAARGRVLAHCLQGPVDNATQRELERVGALLRDARFTRYLVAVNALLAA